MLFREISENGIAVANGVVLVDDVRQLAARCLRGVDNMLVTERHSIELQEGEYLQPVAVVIGDAEQWGIGIECKHGKTPTAGIKTYGALLTDSTVSHDITTRLPRFLVANWGVKSRNQRHQDQGASRNCGHTRRWTMSDWLHNLPLIWMAL